MHRTTTIKQVGWGDGDSPEWKDDGCGFFIVKLSFAAALIVCALRAVLGGR